MVKIDSGELPSAIGKEGHELTQVVHEWQKVAHGRFPDDCSKLLQMIQETDRLKLWTKPIGGFTYKSRNEFLQKKVLINFDLTEANVSRIVHLLKGGEIEAAQEVLKSKDKIRELRTDHPEWTQQQIAEEVNVDKAYVSRVLTNKLQCNNTVNAPEHIKTRPHQADFRKLPPELQAKVASREISLNQAAIQSGIRKKPTPEETIVKAFAKATGRLQVAKAIISSLNQDEAAALLAWLSTEVAP
jgi:DNA-binding MarR family transcriptional regulator